VRPRLDAQLPPKGPARVAAIAMLAVGAAVAIGLTALILLFAISVLRS
jgi:hypothetical protein